MIALDTNILVYAHRAGVPAHGAAKRSIEELAGSEGGWCIPSPCIAEFWAVVTHPTSAGRPSSPREARQFLNNLVAAGAKILYPRNGAMDRLLVLRRAA